MQSDFKAISELKPGPKWLAQFQSYWPAYKAWFLRSGLPERATVAQGLRNLEAHMPEFVEPYHALCALVEEGDTAHRFLSLYRPPAYISGCSQLISPGSSPFLLRNYDYSPVLFDGFLLKSRWIEKDVMGTTDCLVGLLDGINSDGLTLSLTFGGSHRASRGFGIPLILRYVLETCDDARQASTTLARLPSHMAYNVTVLDKYGDFFTACMRPGQANIIQPGVAFATNHQQSDSEWPEYTKVTRSYEREAELRRLASDADCQGQQLVQRFLSPPLYASDYNRGHGTLYTTAYSPDTLEMDVHWPGQAALNLQLHNYEEQVRTVVYCDD